MSLKYLQLQSNWILWLIFEKSWQIILNLLRQNNKTVLVHANVLFLLFVINSICKSLAPKFLYSDISSFTKNTLAPNCFELENYKVNLVLLSVFEFSYMRIWRNKKCFLELYSLAETCGDLSVQFVFNFYFWVIVAMLSARALPAATLLYRILYTLFLCCEWFTHFYSNLVCKFESRWITAVGC